MNVGTNGNSRALSLPPPPGSCSAQQDPRGETQVDSLSPPW